MRSAISSFVMIIVLGGCGAKEPIAQPVAAAPVKANEADPEPAPTKPPETKAVEEQPAPAPEAAAPVKVEFAGLDPLEAASLIHTLAQGQDAKASLRALPVADEVVVEVFTEACDGKRSSCRKTEKLAAADFIKWVDDVVVDPPGWDAGEVGRCQKGCCKLRSVSEAAARQGLSVPHEMYELTQVCFGPGGDKAMTVTALFFIGH